MFKALASRVTWPARERWFVGLAVALVVFLGSGCAWFGRRPAPADTQAVRESELHALPIAPDVDYAGALDLGDGRKLYHSGRDLLYAEGDQFYPVVVRGYPHLVGPSPGGEAVAFLEPFEFEMATDLYVFDIPARTLRRLTDHHDHGSTLSIKAARWFDDRTLYYLEGYRYGTVSRGGDLWRVDLTSLERRPVVRVMGLGAELEEIVGFEFVPHHKLIRYVVARYDQSGAMRRKSLYCTLDGEPVD
ncbi:hypothetical protein AMJ85_11580 [candidate division BRC1 bacterium SM23_51]|nr:MAG: hypothetical protein AMJ85_11580 [candidate division BRC1 bacterium SM23_51]